VLFNFLFQFLDGFEAADIGWNRPRQATSSLDCLLGLAQFFCVAGNYNDLGSVCGQVKCSCSAESTPGAGDHGHFAFQLKAHFDFFFGFVFG
jgi:hypothetical protein